MWLEKVDNFDLFYDSHMEIMLISGCIRNAHGFRSCSSDSLSCVYDSRCSGATLTKTFNPSNSLPFPSNKQTRKFPRSVAIELRYYHQTYVNINYKS